MKILVAALLGGLVGAFVLFCFLSNDGRSALIAKRDLGLAEINGRAFSKTLGLGHFTVLLNDSEDTMFVVAPGDDFNALVKISVLPNTSTLRFVEVSNQTGKSVFLNLNDSEQAFVALGIEDRESQTIAWDINVDGTTDVVDDLKSHESFLLFEGSRLPAEWKGDSLLARVDGEIRKVVVVKGTIKLESPKAQ